MKEIKAHRRKDGRWEAKGVHPITRQRKSYYGKSEHEAKQLASDSLKFSDDRTVYGYYANSYLPHVQGRSTGWLDQISYAMDKFIIPTFGHLDLGDVKRAEVQLAFNRWASLRKQDGTFRYKKETLRRIKIVFSGVMRLALRDELILRNPLEFINVHGEESEEKISLTKEQLWSLYLHADKLTRPIILLAGFCGLRIGECLGVTRSAISDIGTLEVVQQVLQYQGGCQISTKLKTKQSKREIPLPIGLQEALFNCEQISAVFVCSDTKGGYLTPNNATRGLQAACQRAEIPRISPHILRHTFISLMENEFEAPISIVEDLAGKSKKGRNTAGYSHTQRLQMATWMNRYWAEVSMSHTVTEETGLQVISNRNF